MQRHLHRALNGPRRDDGQHEDDTPGARLYICTRGTEQEPVYLSPMLQVMVGSAHNPVIVCFTGYRFARQTRDN
jgi:hypothetical protein